MQHQVVEQQHAARAQRHVHHVQRRLAAQIREVRAEVEALVRLVCRVLPALAVAAPRDLSRVEGERVSQRQRMELRQWCLRRRRSKLRPHRAQA